MIAVTIIVCTMSAGARTCEPLEVEAKGVATVQECIARVDKLILPQLVAMGAEIAGVECKITSGVKGPRKLA